MVYFTQLYPALYMMIVHRGLVMSDALIICFFILNRQKQKVLGGYCSVMNIFHILTFQIMVS